MINVSPNDVKTLSFEMDISAEEAELCLRECKGDMLQAMKKLIS